MNHPTVFSRRAFLRRAAILGGTIGGLGTLGLFAGSRPAQAAQYQALVCIYLSGGNDGLNMVVPSDAAGYAKYAAVRKTLALPQSALIALGSGLNFGLHPAMSALQGVVTAGHLAPVFNLGTLAVPLTKADYLAARPGDGRLPDSLYSHSDQAIEWQAASSHSIVSTGWGGRAVDTLSLGTPVVSVAGNGQFGLSAKGSPLVLPATPGNSFGLSGLSSKDVTNASSPAATRKAALDALYAEAQTQTLATAYASEQTAAVAISESLAPYIAMKPDSTGNTAATAAIDTAFKSLITGTSLSTGLARQLYQIAKLINVHATLGSTQQIYFAEMGGFDTHADQVSGGPASGNHANLLKELADAMAAFQAAMNNLSLGSQVTVFTESDFGRTFAINQTSGTDHAWGNTHLVMGGAVKGGVTYGSFPDLTLGGPDDVGTTGNSQGRWIPTSSVDQYAATLLAWLGASSPQLDQILPNLAQYGTRNLGFV